MTARFLDGIRVLDLSQFLPGPFATQMLADLGADVVKVEPPRGDPMRDLNPITNERGPGPFHAAVNAGKRILRLDLKTDDGHTAMETLVGGADVLLESFRPGVLDRLGFGWPRLKELNPRLIHCALSGYGQTGPQRLWAGHDINYVAMTGALDTTGPDARPQPAFPPIADYGGALQAVIAILGALVGRGKSGRGVHLDVAMADAVLAWQAYGMVQAGLAERGSGSAPARGRDLLTGGAACYRVYETRDGRFVSLGAIEAAFWNNFCSAVGKPEWAGRQLEPMPQTDLISDAEDLFKSHDRDHWDDLLVPADCCYHPVLTYGELAKWPQIEARGLLAKVPAGGAYGGIGFPVIIDGAKPAERPAAREVSVEHVLVTWKGGD